MNKDRRKSVSSTASLNKSGSNKLLYDKTNNLNFWTKNNYGSANYLLAGKNNNESHISMKYNSTFDSNKTSYVQQSNNFCSSKGLLKLHLADE